MKNTGKKEKEIENIVETTTYSLVVIYSYRKRPTPR